MTKLLIKFSLSPSGTSGKKTWAMISTIPRKSVLGQIEWSTKTEGSIVLKFVHTWEETKEGEIVPLKKKKSMVASISNSFQRRRHTIGHRKTHLQNVSHDPSHGIIPILLVYLAITLAQIRRHGYQCFPSSRLAQRRQQVIFFNTTTK